MIRAGNRHIGVEHANAVLHGIEDVLKEATRLHKSPGLLVLLGEVAEYHHDAGHLLLSVSNGRGGVGKLILATAAGDELGVVRHLHGSSGSNGLQDGVIRGLAGNRVYDTEHLVQRLPCRLPKGEPRKLLGYRIHAGNPRPEVGDDDGVTD